VGKEHWRSLDELADTPEFRTLVEKEFPGLAEDLLSPQTRRAFLKIMGASLGVAGLASCRWPKELILPFAHGPEGRTPGVPQQYATAMELGGAAIGLLVTSYDGRPVKIEGNPLHPTSRGTATALAQASLLELYDPDRSRQPIRREGGQEIPQTWDDFITFAGPHFARLQADRGRGLAVLSEESSSPSLARLRKRFAEVFPEASWYEWEPLSRDNEREGARLAFGKPIRPQYHFDRADVIVCLDADPLFDHPAALKHARDFASRRRAEDGTMSRLYAVEPVVSLTGAMADQRLAVSAPMVEAVTWAVARELSSSGLAIAGIGPGSEPADEGIRNFVKAVGRDLFAKKRAGLVVAGSRQPAVIHMMVHRINDALDNAGQSVSYLDDAGWSYRPTDREAIRDLAQLAKAGKVATLLILGGNPVVDAPADLSFSTVVAKVPTTIRLGLFEDETSRLCRWHLPRAHYLESWGDARAWDGTISVQQPLIDALHGGRSPLEVLAEVIGEPVTSGYEIVRSTLKEIVGGTEFEGSWRRALNDGVVANSAFKPVTARVAEGTRNVTIEPVAEGPPLRSDTVSVIFTPDPSTYDGRFANNAWLQELPDPLTKVVWDNAALLGPDTAGQLGIKHGDLIKIKRGGRELEIAAYLMPGQAESTVVLPLGYGRSAAGRVGTGVGFDTYLLRTTDALYSAAYAAVEKTGRTHELVCTQDHQAIDRVGYQERGTRIGELIREATLAEYRANPGFARDGQASERTALFASPGLTGEHQWAMSIDLSACIGCNACTVACQAENNIAVVGKDQVARGREMHWIRVDRYFAGKPEAPGVAFQPVACQHCENAPCEQVCPVAATVHSDEGINEQVYNRCVGTRYCSNNCPYKVRRFNFFNYFKSIPEVEKMVFNPEVTVRGRGVMEKCSFCIQRIEAVKIAAGNDRRPIRDGEIVPACAQTCPTRAIVFGDLKDPGSRVSKLHADQRSYSILGELGTKPRTRYLARLRNPAPKLGEGS
jgi:MoCo/4Fe-4S cofactor protein with predicted Tat translocation signal